MKAPPRDSAQTASIFKTRSFQFLVDAVGAENIALGLESNMTRVAELMKGEGFTPETAFHMETTLGLPHGFFDQPHPVLAPETIARLKSPLDFVKTDSEPEVESETLIPASAANGGHQPFLEDNLSEETEMPKKATGGSSGAAKKSRSQLARQTDAHTPRKKASPSKSRTSSETTRQQPLALDDSATVENVRRQNLHVLTSRNGSKARLGVVMEMTGSNMAHRLYGKKRMDDVEASRFTERLGLPTGWLDTPRSEAEIPESVSRLLTPASRGRAVEQHEPISAATKDDASGKSATAKAHTRRTRAGVPIEPESSSPAPADVAREKEAIVVNQQDHLSGAPAEGPGRSSEGSDGKLLAFTSATVETHPLTALPQQKLASLPASVTSLDNLYGIAPIAEALIKTLAGKARTGRLDEMKALELLQQAVLL